MTIDTHYIKCEFCDKADWGYIIETPKDTYSAAGYKSREEALNQAKKVIDNLKK